MSYKKITLFLFLGVFLFGKNINAQTQTFNYTGSIQNWTVPCATVITIDCSGAQGGTAESSVQGGMGAEMVGTFTVTPGQVLTVVVGGQGVSSGANPGSGGGGGSAVLYNATPWIVAGGGGGRNGGGYSQAAGTTTTGGQNGSGCCSYGGQGGTGGADGSWVGYPVQLSGPSFAYGGRGINTGDTSSGKNGYSPYTTYTAGSWGSGGGGGGVGAGDCNCGGGGGGYSGGGAGGINGDGGGGGSYNAGANQVNSSGVRSGNGIVVVTWNPIVVPVTASGHVVYNEVTCDGQTGEANAVATGIALTYSWTGGQTTDTATGLTAGNYTVTVNSACGSSASASVTITQPANVISASASVISNVFCNGGHDGSASVTVSGVGSPYTYMWTPSNETNATANSLTAGIYSVTVHNACGASATASVIITQPPSLSLTVISTGNVLCNGGNNGSASATAHSGTPPYAYSWSPYGGITDSAVGLTAGNYTIKLTDANGCTGSASVTITQPTVLTASTSVLNNVLCNGGRTGSAMTTAVGGTGPYTYAWTGGQSNATANGLTVGSYTISIIDANGCTTSSGTTLTQPTALQVLQGSTLDSGKCTGSAWVTVSGGVDPYTYLWSNGSISYYLHYVCHDTFCYKVTDHNGCKDSGCIDVPTDLGVANINNNSGNLKVYPNPNSGQFTIQLTGISGQLSVEVYNVLGEKVYSQLSTSNTQLSINLSSQPNGIYLYRVISSDNGNLIGEGKIEIAR